MHRRTWSNSPQRPLRPTTTPRLRVEALEDRLPPGDAALSWLLTLPAFGHSLTNVPDQTGGSTARLFTQTQPSPTETLRLVEPQSANLVGGTTLVTVPTDTTTPADAFLVSPFAGDPLQALAFTSDAATHAAPRLGIADSGRADVGSLGIAAGERASESQGIASTPVPTLNRLPMQAVVEGMSNAAGQLQAAAVPPVVADRAAEPIDPASSAPQTPDACDYGPDVTAPEGARTITWQGSSMCAMPGQYLTRFSGISGPEADQTAAARQQIEAAGLTLQDVRYLNMDGMFRITVAEDLDFGQVEQALRGIDGFRYVEPNGVFTVQLTPNDPRYGELYGLHNTGQSGGIADSDIDAPEAWDVSVGNTRTIVAVVDTGIDYDHIDLYRNMWINQQEIPATRMANLTDIDGDEMITFRDLNDPSNQGPFKITDQNADGRISGTDILRPMNVDGGGQDLGTGGWRNGRSDHGDTAHPDDLMGYRFVGAPNPDPMDDMGGVWHGTHCAGTIGAEGNNGVGVVGVNWNVLFVAVKFLGAGGGGTWEDSVLAVNYLTNLRATYGVDIKLSSNSWGGQPGAPPYPPNVQALRDAIEVNGQTGMLFVAAAGNGSQSIEPGQFVPAGFNLPSILSVAATDRRDERAGFSNWGLNRVQLGAPGVDILSTQRNNTYGLLSGTSMAAPHVAGAAALAWSISPGATSQQVVEAMLETVDPNNSLRRNGPNPVSTGGRLNASRLLARMGFQVLSSTPADGSITDTQPTSYVVNFTHAYDAATLQASDLTVNMIAADRVTATSPTSVTFEYDVSPVTAEGPQAMSIAQGAIEADPSVPLPDRAIRAWNTVFRYDLVPLVVTATNPANASVVELPFTRIEVSFNEAIDPASVGINDLTLARGRVTAAEALDATTVAYTLAGVSGEGAFAITMPMNAVTDIYGNPLRTYTGSFSLDLGIVPFTTPLRSVRPSNSLVYQESMTGILSSAEDQDGFTLRIDPGQTISVVVDPAAALRPAVDLYVMIDGVPEFLAMADATAAGRDAVIQPVATRDDLGGPQEYMVMVRNAGAAAGNFRVQVVLNAANEDEAHDGATNNTLETAQDINASFSALAAGSRGAVLGTSDTGNNFDYYYFTVEENQSATFGVRNLGNTTLSLELLDSSGTVLATGEAVPTGQVDRAITGFVAAYTDAYWVRVRGAGAATDYSLVVTRDADLDWFIVPNGAQTITSRVIDGTQYVLGFTGRGAAGGGGLSMAIIDQETYGQPEANEVAARELGYNVTRLPRATWFTADLTQYNVVVMPSRFDFRDVNTNLAVLTNYVRNGGVFVAHVVDFGANMNLLPGWNRMVVANQGGADINITDASSGLINGPGGTITNANLDGGNSSNHGFILTTNFDIPGEVILHAANDPRQAVTFTYELGAGKVLVSTIPTECYFPTGHNCSSLNHPALYRVYLPNELAFAASLATPPGDWYQIEAVAGAALKMTTATPGDQDGAFENILDAQIQLYDANGTLVAMDDNSLDGRNALVTYDVPQGGAGTYYIRVLASDATKQPTRGEYVLSVSNVSAGPGGSPGAGGGFQALLVNAAAQTVTTPVTPVQRTVRTPAPTLNTEARRVAVVVREDVDRVFATHDLQDEAWWMAGF